MRVPIEVATISIEDLQLSTRALNCLKREEIETLEDLFAKYNSIEELMQIRNMGINSAKEIVAKVQKICPEYTIEKIETYNEQEDELFINRIKSMIISLGLICGENKESYATVLADLQDLINEASRVRENKRQLLKAQKTIYEQNAQIKANRRYIMNLENRVNEQHTLIQKLSAEKNYYEHRSLMQEKEAKKKSDEPAAKEITKKKKKDPIESVGWLAPIVLILIAAGIALVQHLTGN